MWRILFPKWRIINRKGSVYEHFLNENERINCQAWTFVLRESRYSPTLAFSLGRLATNDRLTTMTSIIHDAETLPTKGNERKTVGEIMSDDSQWQRPRKLRHWTTASTVVQFPTTISFRIRMLYLFLPYYRLLVIVVSRVCLTSHYKIQYILIWDEITRDASATRVLSRCASPFSSPS